MEDKNTRNLGGETAPLVGEGALIGGQVERFVPENLQSMGEGALEGLDELPMPTVSEPTEEVKKVIQGGGVIAASGEADSHTEKGVDTLVERAEKSVEKAKREHNFLKMQEEKITLGREVLEMMRGNGGVQ